MLDVFFTLEANEQLEKLEIKDSNKILRAIRVFKTLPIQAKNSKNLGDGLFEIKADNTRAYYKYHKGKIIIIGLIVLKKSQKAPKRYMEQAIRNIDKFIIENKDVLT